MHRSTTITALITLAVVAFGSAAMAQLWLEPRCQALPLTNVTQLVELRDGRLLAIEGATTKTSSDDGKTWSTPRTIYDGPAPGVPTQDYSVLFRTKAGTLLVVYMDASTEKWGWDGAKNEAIKDGRLDVWAIRSVDEGETWIDRQRILDGYCGALIGLVQTSRGDIVAPMQDLAPGRNRNATLTCVSADDGKTWRPSNVIDLGGRGDHDGAIEATAAELKSGRLLMLIRTNLDRFWEAYSDDGGRYWREIRPSQLDASSSPGYLIRLASGRLALVWNRLYNEGRDSITRGDLPTMTETKASWQREELSMAFSEEDAKTWTKPVVIARQPGAELSYPFVFERRPGELWIIMRYPVKVSFSLKEADFCKGQ